MEERDFYGEIRDIAEEWLEIGITKEDMLAQLEVLVTDLEEE